MAVQISENNDGLVMYHRQEATGRVSAFECWEEFFVGRMVDWDPITIDTTYLDFSLGKPNVETPEKIVYVKNNLADPVTVMWMSPWEYEHPHVALHRARYVANKLPHKTNSVLEPLRTIFRISPEKTKIAAGSSMPFSFTFKPPQVNITSTSMKNVAYSWALKVSWA